MDTVKELLIKALTLLLTTAFVFSLTSCRRSKHYERNHVVDTLFAERDSKRELTIVDCFITNEYGHHCDIRVYSDGWIRTMIVQSSYKTVNYNNWASDSASGPLSVERNYTHNVKLKEWKLSDSDFEEVSRMVKLYSDFTYLEEIDVCDANLVIMYFPRKEKVFRFYCYEECPMYPLKRKLAELADYQDWKYSHI